jgi:subtilase family serine protease
MLHRYMAEHRFMRGVRVRAGGTENVCRGGGVIAVSVVVTAASLLAAGCSSTSPPPPVSLPAVKSGEITFYVSLPSSTTALDEAVASVSTPGSAQYRHFMALDSAASKFGATNAQISAVATSVDSLGLGFEADPTRLFGRVTGSAQQWKAALGASLSSKAATASSPFTTYSLPSDTPGALQPQGSSLLLRQAQVYDAAAQANPPSNGTSPSPTTSLGATGAQSTAAGALPWPLNNGTPLTAGCSSPLLQHRHVYTEQQVQTAYSIGQLRSHSAGTPVITVIDLGGGWLPSDLKQAGQCFGYPPPAVNQAQGDGVPAAIQQANDETSLDVQTVAAVATGEQLRLVQTTPSGMLDGFSRALAGWGTVPDVLSLSYGGCALAENTAAPAYATVSNNVLAMTALTGVSSFVAAGDSGSTTCGTSVSGTTLSYPAVSPYVTAVGGTRLALGAGNTRVSEVVWNDSKYGEQAAGGGGMSRKQPRPAYQEGFNPQNHRAVPDVSVLADIVPGWPEVINGKLQTVGGTSGATPLVAAATALVDAAQQKAGQPLIGLANGWFYRAAKSQPAAFFDITKGSNDLAGVGCCQAAAGYDLASGLGVPNWAVLPGQLPPPG